MKIEKFMSENKYTIMIVGYIAFLADMAIGSHISKRKRDKQTDEIIRQSAKKNSEESK